VAAFEETCQGEETMKFSAVVLIVPEEDENPAVRILKEAGATGITIIKGKGLRQHDRKTFLGLGLERRESLMMCVVEKQLAMRILKAVKIEMKLDLPGGGLAFSLPLGSVVGIGMAQLESFRREVADSL
jgi:nitrogen regulatory protein PII